MYAMILPDVRYPMSGTDVALCSYAMPQVLSAMLLCDVRCCARLYRVFDTDVPYATARVRYKCMLCCYAFATQCPVLALAMLLRERYASPGTEVGRWQEGRGEWQLDSERWKEWCPPPTPLLPPAIYRGVLWERVLSRSTAAEMGSRGVFDCTERVSRGVSDSIEIGSRGEFDCTEIGSRGASDGTDGWGHVGCQVLKSSLAPDGHHVTVPKGTSPGILLRYLPTHCPVLPTRVLRSARYVV
eukprot:3941257-Rhodomonas_salina.1